VIDCAEFVLLCIENAW